MLTKVKEVEEQTGRHATQIKEDQIAIDDFEAKIAELTRIRMLNRQIDKHLHNRKLEIKGNIRVFCRVRPVLQHEIDKAKMRV